MTQSSVLLHRQFLKNRVFFADLGDMIVLSYRMVCVLSMASCYEFIMVSYRIFMVYLAWALSVVRDDIILASLTW
jgi:hypothetical protein